MVDPSSDQENSSVLGYGRNMFRKENKSHSQGKPRLTSMQWEELPTVSQEELDQLLIIRSGVNAACPWLPISCMGQGES